MICRSNVKQNFDPIEFGEKFNNCLFPKLEQNFRRQDRSYSFQCTLSPTDKKDKKDKH